MNRRQAIAGLAAGAAAAAIPGVAGAAGSPEPSPCGLTPDYFPNVVLHAHDGRRGRFFEDLLRDRVVVIQFLSVRGQEHYPVVENLAKAQAVLGDRMGREVFFYSITTDPEHDTPRVLADFAKRHGAGPGWLFLTGEPADLETLRGRFFVHDTGPSHAHHAPGAAPVEDCSRGLLRYGNAATGLWGAVPAKADPRWIAERLFWVQAGKRADGPPRRRGPLPRTSAVLLALGLLAASARAQSTDPYQHPHPQALLKPSVQSCEGETLVVATGESLFAPSRPFLDPPGTSLLPTIYTDLFDGAGQQIPNTLPSTPTVPYNLHDGQPAVTPINPTSPTEDLRHLLDRIARAAGRKGGPDSGEAAAARETIQKGIDILEGNPVPDRAYSGFPLLHYTGPEKMKRVTPIKDANGKVIGGNLDVHQIWFDGRIESDTGLVDPTPVAGVPWTVTYTVDVLTRGEDDFSPYVMYVQPPASPNGPPQPWVGMDQSFFPMADGTRTVFKIKMAPGEYYNLVYTWGWRMHPPRAQTMDNMHKTVTARADPCGQEPGVTRNLLEWEQSVFGENPRANEESRLKAIAKIGDMAPAKRMWNSLRAARDAARQGDWPGVARQEALAREAFLDWKDRTQLPGKLEPDPESDLTLLYVNNTIYGEFTRGTLTNLPDFQTRGATVRVTLLNGDNFEHGYQNVDFGGARGWENQFKSSVKVGGSGCWFTFGRNYWSMLLNPIQVVPPALAPDQPSKRKVQMTFNFDPGRRLRFYQFDPLHHDVAIFSVH